MYLKEDKVWFVSGPLSKEIGFIDKYLGEGYYLIRAKDKGNKLYYVFLMDIEKF